MPIPDVAYHRPSTLEEARQLAESLGEGAHYLAGGTELLPELKRGRATARHLISLKEVRSLAEISADDSFLHVGAMATLSAVARSDLVCGHCPVLAEAAAAIGSVQIREQGTIGGNFCGAVPCADTPPSCIAGRAEVVLSSSEGDRVLPAEDFFVGPRETVLRPGEVLLEVRIPHPGTGHGASYQRFGLRRGMAVAVASVAAALWMEGEVVREARIALGAVAPVPLLAVQAGALLSGKTAGPEAFEPAAVAAGAEARPICDVRGSEEYRREVVHALTRRALVEAAARAGRQEP